MLSVLTDLKYQGFPLSNCKINMEIMLKLLNYVDIWKMGV